MSIQGFAQIDVCSDLGVYSVKAPEGGGTRTWKFKLQTMPRKSGGKVSVDKTLVK